MEFRNSIDGNVSVEYPLDIPQFHMSNFKP